MIKQKLKLVRNKIRRVYRTYFTSENAEKSLLSDKRYLEHLYFRKMGKKLDLKNPQTFNEKLQWLKLYDRKPEYTVMVDKYAAKQYVADIIGEEHIIPTLGLYDSPDEIDFDKLPDQFVLKCTHSSGIGSCVCTDKSTLDIEKVKSELQRGLDNDYFLDEREWPYKNVPRKIICEKYMEDTTTKELSDYKFFCFDGVPKIMFIASRRFADEETKFDFFDHLDIINGHPNAEVCPKKPKSFEKMKKIASKLSAGVPHLRVDLYEVDGQIYFGELTFSHWGGFTKFEPEEWDYTIGSWLTLPKKKKR